MRNTSHDYCLTYYKYIVQETKQILVPRDLKVIAYKYNFSVLSGK